MGPYLEKPFTKIGLVEWLKVKVLGSSPSTAKKKRKKRKKENGKIHVIPGKDVYLKEFPELEH
jgi:hypothetical protein